MKIYRSMHCSGGSGYPLKKVEVIEEDGKFGIFIYDVGFEPPFWDVSKIPGFMTLTFELKTFDDVVEYLENEKNISVSGWQIVPKLFLEVSNSTIRDEIRYNLNEDEEIKHLLDEFISIDSFIEAFDFFFEDSGRKYGGQMVYAKMLFQSNQLDMSGSFLVPKFESKPTLLSYENVGAFIPAHSSENTRNPEFIGKHRLIIKGTNDNSSFGCVGSEENDPICNVYDQDSRTFFNQGRAIQINLNFFNKKESFVLDNNGFRKSTDEKECVWNVIGL